MRTLRKLLMAVVLFITLTLPVFGQSFNFGINAQVPPPYYGEGAYSCTVFQNGVYYTYPCPYQPYVGVPYAYSPIFPYLGLGGLGFSFNYFSGGYGGWHGGHGGHWGGHGGQGHPHGWR